MGSRVDGYLFREGPPFDVHAYKCRAFGLIRPSHRADTGCGDGRARERRGVVQCDAVVAHETEHGPKSVADLAERLMPAVVNISTRSFVEAKGSIPIPKVPEGSPFQEFFEDFFEKNQQSGNRQRSVQSLGSGFIVDASGLIVTNNHVISGADRITITFSDGSETDAEVVGRDTKTDLALLKVETSKPLATVAFEADKDIRVGDWVMAIGNPFGLGGSVSIGIVSARNRDINTGPYDSFIQTDASINRGNSGGPLFDMYGNVVGVNTAIISQSGASIGLGFAIPSNIAGKVIDQLQTYGETRRGWLGIRIQQVSGELAEGLGLGEASGVLISWINEDGPAQAAGLQAGDVIVGYNGQKVEEVRDLTRFVADTTIGETAQVDIIRKGTAMTVPVVVGHMETSELELSPGQDEPAEIRPELFGMSLSKLTEAERRKHNLGKAVEGVVVHSVEAGSIADAKGVKEGMVIVEMDQTIVSTPEDLMAKIDAKREEGKKTIVFLFAQPDGGEFIFVPMKLDEQDPAMD
ncbi:Do family serine endopeptidase [uncultured Cohaesibacter sp.]|uniref:Do family serine endopeptidase n=1 Tax=uncultured Cohaesibacter sp. TaxID=1002546 RepID=UPI0029C6DED8|nr:Do family serine endopeptidase [uncultured Cohaesibacter sp.]